MPKSNSSKSTKGPDHGSQEGMSSHDHSSSLSHIGAWAAERGSSNLYSKKVTQQEDPLQAELDEAYKNVANKSNGSSSSKDVKK